MVAENILTKDSREIADMFDSFREAVYYIGLEFWQGWSLPELDLNVGSATDFVILSLSFFIFKRGLIKFTSLGSYE